jgi:hypothetical protein
MVIGDIVVWTRQPGDYESYKWVTFRWWVIPPASYSLGASGGSRNPTTTTFPEAKAAIDLVWENEFMGQWIIKRRIAKAWDLSRPTRRSSPFSNLLHHIAISDTLSNVLRLTVIRNTPQTPLRHLLSRRYLCDVSLKPLVTSLSLRCSSDISPTILLPSLYHLLSLT